MADLHAVTGLFEAKGVSHDETCTERSRSIGALEPFGRAVEQREMASQGPDNIQVELTAPLG